jgi:D-methionine transport system substrate-binding protein
MNKNRTIFASVIFFILVLLLGACSSKQKKETLHNDIKRNGKTILVGASLQNTTYYDLFVHAIKPVLEKKGYKIIIKEINDPRTYNTSLESKDFDLNVGQHKAALDVSVERDNLHISPLITIPSAIYGIYTKKLKAKNLEELKKELKPGDVVAIPNDPSNLSRALIFLENIKLIKLNSGVNRNLSTEKDIVENPYKLEFRTLQSAMIGRSLESVSIGLLSGAEANYAGIFDSCIVREVNPDDCFLIIFAIRTEDLNTAWAKDFVDAVQSEEFKNVIEDPQYIFHKYYRPAWYVKKWGIENKK